jgi:formyl-CoA transferase
VLAGGRRPIATRDGHVSMLPYTEAHWIALLRETGNEEAIDRLQVGDRHARNRNVRELYALLAKIVAAGTTAHWIEVCERLDIPATPIHEFDTLPEHPHLKAVGLFGHAEHPTEGPIRYVRPTVRFSASPAQVHRHAPALGADTGAILRELGYGEVEIGRLFDSGAVAGSRPE